MLIGSSVIISKDSGLIVWVSPTFLFPDNPAIIPRWPIVITTGYWRIRDPRFCSQSNCEGRLNGDRQPEDYQNRNGKKNFPRGGGYHDDTRMLYYREPDPAVPLKELIKQRSFKAEYTVTRRAEGDGRGILRFPFTGSQLQNSVIVRIDFIRPGIS